MSTRMLSLLALILLAACSSSESQDTTPPGAIGSEEVPPLVQSNNQFGLALLRELHEPGANTSVSPLSVAVALQMAAVGADGDTLREMRQTLNVEDVNLPGANRAMLEELAQRDDVRLEVANSVWSDTEYPFRDDYVKTLIESFRAGAFIRDMSSEKALTDINRWVNEHTGEKIPQLLNEIPPDTQGYLVNAVYFKGAWTKPFNETYTRDADFHPEDGDTTTVRMMHRRGEFDSYDDDGVHVARLRLGNNESASMWFALPREGDRLKDLLKDLDADRIAGWTNGKPGRAKLLYLPKFKLDSDHDLVEPLKRMGIRTAFTDAADFRHMADGLKISECKHRVLLEVNETGAEGAAATVVGMVPTSVPRELTFDRPFFFAITDDATGAMLFAGVVHKP